MRILSLIIVECRENSIPVSAMPLYLSSGETGEMLSAGHGPQKEDEQE